MSIRKQRGTRSFFLAMATASALQLLPCQASANAQMHAATGPVFTGKAARILGIYESVPGGPHGEKAMPATLDQLPLTAASLAAVKPAVDPKDACQVLGPFRQMARSDVRFEILRDAPNKLVFLFEKTSWGHVRTVGMDAEHIPDSSPVRPMWNGDSTGTWQGETLVIDSQHFTNKTWLNEVGVVNSRQLHLTERFRLLDGGKYLEYHATATDPEVLTAPVSYTRYFRRSTREILADNCFAHRTAHEGQ